MLVLLHQDPKLSLVKANIVLSHRIQYKWCCGLGNTRLPADLASSFSSSPFVNIRPEILQHLLQLPWTFRHHEVGEKSSPDLPSSPAVNCPNWNQFALIFARLWNRWSKACPSVVTRFMQVGAFEDMPNWTGANTSWWMIWKLERILKGY